MAQLPEGARVGTVIGRYYAMDRDNRWDRVERAYRRDGPRARATAAETAAAAVKAAYDRGETDEFIAADRDRRLCRRARTATASSA